MKKNFMTRVLAVAMSAAMALSMATATNLTVAEAAAKPAMSSKSFTVRVGSAAKTYRATAATRKAYKIVKASAGNANKATAEIIKAGKAISVAAGTKTGKTTITLTFKNRTTGAKKTLKFAGKVVAAKKVASMTVAQKKADQLELTMGEALTEAPAASKITITREDNVSVSVKAVEIKKEDAKVLVVDTYTDMKDGKKYTVTLDTLSADFTATDGVVADVALDKTEIPVNKLTEVKVQELDKNGIIILEGALGNTGDTRLTVNVEASDGYSDGEKVILYTAGSKAKATITYAGTYDMTGAYVGEIKKDVTITAVASLRSVDNFQMTIQDGTLTQPAWEATSFKANNYISLKDGTSKIWFHIEDNDGDEIEDYYNYTASSSNSDVLIFDEVALDAEVGNTLTAVKEGTCYIVIKKDNTVVKTLPVTVRAQRKVSTLSVVGGNVTLYTNTPDDSKLTPSAMTVVVVKDQFGNAIDDAEFGSALTAKFNSVPAADANNHAKGDDASNVFAYIGNGLYTYNTGLTVDGSYQFAVTASIAAGNANGYAKSSATGYFTLVRKSKTNDSNVQPTNGVFVKTKSVNTTISKAHASLNEVATDVYAATFKGDVVNSVYSWPNGTTPTQGTIMSAVVKTASNKTIYEMATSTTGAAVVKTANDNISTTGTYNTNGLHIVAAKKQSSKWYKTLTPGTYSVEFTVKDVNYKFKSTFTVTDTTEAPTYKVLSSNAENDSASGWATNSDKIKFFYDGVKVKKENISMTDTLALPAGESWTSGSGSTKRVNWVAVYAAIPGDNTNMVAIPVKLGVTLTNCN